MKYAFVVAFFVVVGIIVWDTMSKPRVEVSPAQKAQEKSRSVTEYWALALIENDLNKAMEVCKSRGKAQSKVYLDQLREAEKDAKESCENATVDPMGAKNAWLIMFFAKEAGILMKINVLVEEENGRYWVNRVTR